VRRECLEQIGPAEHRDWHGDWGMWLRIALAGYEFGCVQEPLGSYRMLRGSMIDAKIANAERLVFNILEQVFSRWTMPPEIVAERDQIYGGWHFWISCRYYIGGFWDDARRNLALVIELRPEVKQEPQALLDLFYNDAVSPRGASATRRGSWPPCGSTCRRRPTFLCRNPRAAARASACRPCAAQPSLRKPRRRVGTPAGGAPA